jgi:hypothetical protein
MTPEDKSNSRNTHEKFHIVSSRRVTYAPPAEAAVRLFTRKVHTLVESTETKVASGEPDISSDLTGFLLLIGRLEAKRLNGAQIEVDIDNNLG